MAINKYTVYGILISFSAAFIFSLPFIFFEKETAVIIAFAIAVVLLLAFVGHGIGDAIQSKVIRRWAVNKKRANITKSIVERIPEKLNRNLNEELEKIKQELRKD